MHEPVNTDDVSEDISIHEKAKQKEEEELENKDSDASEGVAEVYTRNPKRKAKGK